MRDWIGSYEKLLRRFNECNELAQQLATPNPEDDIYIRMAIVGYSYYQPTEEWGIDNLQFVRRKREQAYSDDDLADRSSEPTACALFTSLVFGYLLGMFQSGQIDEMEFSRGEAILPGFLELHAGELRHLLHTS